MSIPLQQPLQPIALADINSAAIAGNRKVGKPSHKRASHQFPILGLIFKQTDNKSRGNYNGILE
jgi:hypothetical protein